MRKLELLAPAKNSEFGRTAVIYGADALYIGGPAFGARTKAGNSVEDIADLIEFCRPYGVRVYGALNTLLYDSELKDAERIARELIAAGVDALIIQDMAYLEMDLPPVRFHASTQMFNKNPEDVKFLSSNGFSRIILERGMSLGEISEVSAVSEAELEFFVHGAICVGYSGRCYLSRSICDRSGNRGDCMQACRLKYELTDMNGKPIVEGK